MSSKGYQNLLVWQKAKDLAVMVYKISNDGKLSRDFGLRDQMRRSAVSVPSNIAEAMSAIRTGSLFGSSIWPKAL